jgi:chloramphenicol O-acetyltransferase
MQNNSSYWECPICHKEFARQNQSHQCEVVAIESLFELKQGNVLEVYHELLKKMNKIGNFKITTSSKAITLYTENRKGFMCLQPKKKFIDLWFYLDKSFEEFPVFKVVQASSKKFAHYVRLEEKADVDSFLIGLLKESYDVISKNE